MALPVQNRKIFLKQSFTARKPSPCWRQLVHSRLKKMPQIFSDLTYTICIPYAEYKNTVYKRQQYADRLNNTFAIMKQ